MDVFLENKRGSLMVTIFVDYEIISGLICIDQLGYVNVFLVSLLILERIG